MLMHRADSTHWLCAKKALMLRFSRNPLHVHLQAIALPNRAASMHSLAAMRDEISGKTTGDLSCS
jgi:hypothetical protein